MKRKLIIITIIVTVFYKTGFGKYDTSKSINSLKSSKSDGEEEKNIKYYDYPNSSQYGEYGVDWIYFPDGDGNLKVGFLRHPKYYKINMTSTRSLLGPGPMPEQVVQFIFYNRKNNAEKGRKFTLKDMKKVLQEIDNTKPLKFITHGWLSNGHTQTCQLIKNAYLERDDLNVIVMDWGEISDTVWYYKPLTKTRDVASYYSKIIENIIANGMDPKNIHLIGHSLGAHVSGFAAQTLQKSSNIRIGRITGLDPALPGFVYLTERLSRKDADFVDVIHTSGGFLGILSQIGHADFYPNGGTPPQPGCSGVDEIIKACSHGESWKLFKESINTNFEAFKCDSWDDFELGICIGEKVLFGDPAPHTARGSYYFYTKKA